MAKVRVKTQKELIDVCKEKGYSYFLHSTYTYCNGKENFERIFESDDFEGSFASEMNKYCGNTYNMELDEGFYVYEDWYFSDEMIEVLEEEEVDEDAGITYGISTYSTYIKVFVYKDGVYIDEITYKVNPKCSLRVNVINALEEAMEVYDD